MEKIIHGHTRQPNNNSINWLLNVFLLLLNYYLIPRKSRLHALPLMHLDQQICVVDVCNLNKN